MTRAATPDSGLEIQLMRRGVSSAWAARTLCADCRRTPLVGERVYVFAGERTVCELCRVLRREEPVDSQLVHGAEHGHTVRVRARTP